ncbi:hypothetical protein [Chengkuizengella axinellae]|uniref:Lipoprotein n=1 Tax=Chengkuizengella axinellae TaxID=3064388 RepID=A0ABT9J126_9BACL|nr:hypothetical protein [Chengkuizengella sp. 2205SS18-9]MDP5275302.1 hypothetical protein [Chengkuizengella sp. 2205SS18-9]
MNRRIYIVLILMMIIILIGCSKETTIDKNNIASIQVNKDSVHQKSLEELGIGELFDFHLKLPYADKSRVNLWVEGYESGKKISSSPLTQLSYGYSPNKKSEGSMGFGIIHSTNPNPLFFLYSPEVSQVPLEVELNGLYSSGIRGWSYAIPDETISLKSGETKILGVYGHDNHSLGGYDYTPEGIDGMIKEYELVLILKLKVEKQEE